jgi:hypothetical protein
MYESNASQDLTAAWSDSSQIIEFIPGMRDDVSPFSNLRPAYTSRFLSCATSVLLEEFEERLQEVAKYFPEIEGEIKIGLTNSYRGLAVVMSRGKSISRKLSFPPLTKRGLPSRYVIGHELMHLSHVLKKGFPGTERATDVFTLARLPPKLLDAPPVYLRMPESIRRHWSRGEFQTVFSTLAHDLALDAILSRNENCRYIARWEAMFAKKAQESISLSWPL